jgi:ADP-ribosyl-[dinitrogen reductase] hydrolase
LAAITHGRPSGYLAAGAFASMISCLMMGQPMEAAIDLAMSELAEASEGEEVLRALEGARRAAHEMPATPETIERLGGGWVAEEALAIAAFCALTASDFRSGVLLAVNHSGDSDSTGAITGNLLGAVLGEEAIPKPWLESLEARSIIETLADDLVRVQDFSSEAVPPDFVERYPGY